MVLLLLKAMHLNCQKSVIILRGQNFIMEVGLWLTCGSSRCLIWQVKNNQFAFELNFRKWRTLEQFSKYSAFCKNRRFSVSFLNGRSSPECQPQTFRWPLVRPGSWSGLHLLSAATLFFPCLCSRAAETRPDDTAGVKVGWNEINNMFLVCGGGITEWLSVSEPQKATKVSKTDGALVLVKQEKRPFVLLSFAPLS